MTSSFLVFRHDIDKYGDHRPDDGWIVRADNVVDAVDKASQQSTRMGRVGIYTAVPATTLVVERDPREAIPADVEAVAAFFGATVAQP